MPRRGAGVPLAWAIGDFVLDLAAHRRPARLLLGARTLAQPVLNAWLARGHEAQGALRAQAVRSCSRRRTHRDTWSSRTSSVQSGSADACAVPGRRLHRFLRRIHHAANVGKQFRPDNPLLPNYKYVPIGYHARASSVLGVGGAGDPSQRSAQGARCGCAGIWAEPAPGLSARARPVDRQGNALGSPIPIGEAGEHIAG